MDDVGQARALEAALRSRIVQDLVDEIDLRVAIVGGGATGVELAAELMRRMGLYAWCRPIGDVPRLRIT